jgi:hypothetical protein
LTGVQRLQRSPTPRDAALTPGDATSRTRGCRKTKRTKIRRIAAPPAIERENCAFVRSKKL